jgi:predicted ATP-grasp superfamily ATP-dependent carboligase
VRALILDEGRDRGALAGARALHRAGWTVGVGSPERRLAASSRATARWHDVPSAQEDAQGYLAATAGAIREGGYDVVFPCDDAGVLMLSRFRDEVPATVPYGSDKSVLRGFDKLELTRAAERAGLAVPATTEANEATTPEDWSGPVVVKPSLHYGFEHNQPGHLVAAIARSPAEVAQRVAAIHAAGERPLVQEVIAGRLMAMGVLADRDSRVIACVQQLAEHTWPPEAGISARARTVPVDAELAEGVAALVRDLGWFGLVQIQFLVPTDGVPRVLDFNGRYYGSLALAVAAGVDLPVLWARLATGRPVGPVAPARTGVRYQWLTRDLKASAAQDGRLRGTMDALRAATRSRHSVWAARDPWPAIQHYGERVFGRLT